MQWVCMVWKPESVLSLISKYSLFANDINLIQTDLVISLLSVGTFFRQSWIQMLQQIYEELCADFILSKAFILWQLLQFEFYIQPA